MELLTTILGLQSSDRFRAERRFNATHCWAPGFDESRFDSYENIRNQQRSHTLPYKSHRGPLQLLHLKIAAARFYHSSEHDMATGTSDNKVTT